LGDSYCVDGDIGELVAYYEGESELRFAEHILTFLLIRSIVLNQTMLFVFSKCVYPEVFPRSFVGNVVENIMRFLKSPVLSIDDSVENLPINSSFDGNDNTMIHICCIMRAVTIGMAIVIALVLLELVTLVWFSIMCHVRLVLTLIVGRRCAGLQV
jgi:hypothetical protein